MNIAELEKKMDKAVADFRSEIGNEYYDFDKEPANHGDIKALAIQTEAALSSFRDSIIEYLKSNA